MRKKQLRAIQVGMFGDIDYITLNHLVAKDRRRASRRDKFKKNNKLFLKI